MKYILKVYNIWEQGPREKQEDAIYPARGKQSEGDRLFILCDGMGGHDSGEVASNTVCEAMSSAIHRQCPDAQGDFSDDNFNVALDEAFKALDKADTGAEKKMGTTLTFLKLHSKGCTIAHMGDSRVYHIRAGENAEQTKILFHTIDHSYINDLLQIGEITEEEAKVSTQKNIITRAMQPMMDRKPKADLYHTTDIRPGDYFFMCSDGIMEQMEDDNLKYIFSEKAGDDQNKVDILTKVTSKNRDNHSAIIVHILDVIDPISEEEMSEEEIGFAATLEFDHPSDENSDSDKDVLVVREAAELSDPRMPERVKRKSHNSINLQTTKWIITAAAVVVLLLCGYFIFIKDSNKDGGDKRTEPTPRERTEQQPSQNSERDNKPSPTTPSEGRTRPEKQQPQSEDREQGLSKEELEAAISDHASNLETANTSSQENEREPEIGKEELQALVNEHTNGDDSPTATPQQSEGKPEREAEESGDKDNHEGENPESGRDREETPTKPTNNQGLMEALDNLPNVGDKQSNNDNKDDESIPSSDQDKINKPIRNK